MKKTDKLQNSRKRLVLSRETVRGLGELSAEQLRRVGGGTCYTDVRISQCCAAA